MSALFVCGFNGFQQCDGLVLIMSDFHKTYCPNGAISSPKAEESDRDPQAYSERTESTCSTCEHLPGFKVDVHADTDTEKYFQEQTEKVDVKDVVDSEIQTGKISAVMTFLKRGSEFSPEVISLKNINITWSRIGVTFAELKGKEKFLTLITGFSADGETSQVLHLHLQNTRLKACTQTCFLLQNEDNYMLLPETLDKAFPISLIRNQQSEDGDFTESGNVSTYSDSSDVLLQSRDPSIFNTDSFTGSDSEIKDCGDSTPSSHSFQLESVGGTVDSFIASYGGISVGSLSIKDQNFQSCNTETTTLMLTPVDSGWSITNVSCGLEHTLLLTKFGGVLSFGSGSRGQLGHGTLEEQQPRMIETLEGLSCISLAAGGWHSAAVSECGDLYIWGWNESGQLGLPSPSCQENKLSINQHHQIKTMDSEGHPQQQQTPASLQLWPVLVEMGVKELSIVGVACGSRHTAIWSGCGKAFTTGWNKYGQLGFRHTCSLDCFTCVQLPAEAVKVSQVWCGAWNTVFVTARTE